jgi:predicted chitinase
MTLTHAAGRTRLLALLAALASVLGLTLVALPAAPAAATATCAAAWSSSAVYTGGMTASYNGDNWSAKWWTQGDIPGNNGQNVWADQGACTSGGGGGGGGSNGFVVSSAQFDQMFPNRNSFYTYDGLVAALSSYPGFATTGSTAVQQQEAAAFLANVDHETGGLVYVTEIDQSGNYCASEPYGCPAGTYSYYGRGPLQISWNFNYYAAGNALGIDLLDNPNLVQTDAAISWKTALWYWMTQSGPGSMTAHDAMVNGAGFGQTIWAADVVLPELTEPQDGFLDFGVPRGGVGDLGADDREACLLKNPERADVVAGGPGVQGPDRHRGEEHREGLTGDALSPGRTVDPIGDLRVALDDEARDAADKASVAGHRARDDIGRGPHRRHVGIERFAVVRVFGGEGCHLDRLRVTHLVEQHVEVGVLDQPQCHLHHRCPPQRSQILVRTSAYPPLSTSSPMSSNHSSGFAAMKSVISATHSGSSSTMMFTPFSASHSWPPKKVRASPTTTFEIPNWRIRPLQYQQGDSVVAMVVPR